MASTFSYELSTSGTPEEAQDRVQRVLTERLRRPGGGTGAGNIHRAMRLSKQTPTSLSYKPKLQVPMPVSILVWLGRQLNGERVKVTFTADGTDGGGTRIAVSGKVGRGGQAVAEREFLGRRGERRLTTMSLADRFRE
jgi:hypothetical protein